MSQRVKKKASPMARQEAVAGYVFILPTILLYLCLTIIPIIVTFSLSFMDYDLVKPSTFIGFDNYIKLFQDSRLGQVALNTVLFALMSVVGNVGIGLLLAVILNRKMPKFFVNFFRFSFFLPVVIGYVYVSIVWSNLYSTDTGVFNYFLSLLGLEKVGWLTNKSIVLFSIILMDIWKNAGFFMVIFLAGLQNIPAQYYEAAQIEFLWMISTSLRPASESMKLPPSFLPTQFEYGNYLELFQSSIPFLNLFGNSILLP